MDELVHGDGRTLYVATSFTPGNIEHKILQFDDVTALVAIYDGQNANSVSKYCATYLDIEIKMRENELKSEAEEEKKKEKMMKKEVVKGMLKDHGDDDDYDDEENDEAEEDDDEDEDEDDDEDEDGEEEEEEEDEKDDCEKLSAAIIDGFGRMDEKMSAKKSWRQLNKEDRNYNNTVGATACLVFIRNDTLMVANAGLSRCVIARKKQCFAVSTDHRPDVPSERKRISNARRGGGRITQQKLTFTRAIGYVKFKNKTGLSADEQLVISKPGLKMVKLKGDIDFIILASENFWDYMGNQEAVNSVYHSLEKGSDLSGACETLMLIHLDNVEKQSMGRISPQERVMIIVMQSNTMQSQVIAINSNNKNDEGKEVFLKHRNITDYAKDPKNWEKLRKTYVLAEDREPDEMRELLRIMELQSIEDGDDSGPKFRIPSQASGLYVYDSHLEQVCLRRGRIYLSRSIDKCKFIQAVLSTAEDLLERSEYNTTHGVAYRIEDICPNRDKVDEAIRELCLLSESTRASLNMAGTPKGSISGPIILTVNDVEIDCEQAGIAGMRLPIETELEKGIMGAKPKAEATLKYILVVEKESIFVLLGRLDFQKTHSCVLVTGSGQPDLMTRVLLSHLQHYLQIPMYCLVDANPHGFQIYTTYKFGSESMGFDNSGRTNPSMELIGLFPTDISKVKSRYRSLLTRKDWSCLRGLLKKKHIKNDKLLASQLRYMRRNGYKAQLESLQASHGSDALVRYIDENINLMEQKRNEQVTNGQVQGDRKKDQVLE